MRIAPAAELSGHVAVPGDKSISHRSVLFGALSEGDTHVRGFGRAGDTESTIAAVRALGVEVDDVAHDELVVHGAELREGSVDCGNAGTLVPRPAGILVGKEGRCALRCV